MNEGLLEAMEVLEKEKNIAKDTLIEAIEDSLLTVCKNHFGKADNVRVTVNSNTCDLAIYTEETIAENVEDDILEISLVDARMLSSKYEMGGMVQIPLDSKEFGRIATQNAKNVTLQEIRGGEHKVLYNEYCTKEGSIMTGIVQHHLDKNVSINLGRVDAILDKSERVRGETFRPVEHIKVYVVEVRDISKGSRVSISRTHPDFIECLLEPEVAEVYDGTMEIKAVAREVGPRTKITVESSDSNVNPVSTCVDLDGAEVDSVVSELRGGEINIINWDDDPACLIKNTLNLTKVIYMVADEGAWEAQMIVPDYQLSLIIGEEGRDARLAARLANFKIDIKSEIQIREMELLEQMGLQHGDTPTTSFKEETYEGPENYQECQEDYRGDVNKQE